MLVKSHYYKYEKPRERMFLNWLQQILPCQESDRESKAAYVLIWAQKNVWKHVYQTVNSNHCGEWRKDGGVCTSYWIQACRGFHPPSVDYFSDYFKCRIGKQEPEDIRKHLPPSTSEFKVHLFAYQWSELLVLALDPTERELHTPAVLIKFHSN